MHWTVYINHQTLLTAVSKRLACFLLRHWRETKGVALAATWTHYEATK